MARRRLFVLMQFFILLCSSFPEEAELNLAFHLSSPEFAAQLEGRQCSASPTDQNIAGM